MVGVVRERSVLREHLAEVVEVVKVVCESRHCGMADITIRDNKMWGGKHGIHQLLSNKIRLISFKTFDKSKSGSFGLNLTTLFPWDTRKASRTCS